MWSWSEYVPGSEDHWVDSRISFGDHRVHPSVQTSPHGSVEDVWSTIRNKWMDDYLSCSKSPGCWDLAYKPRFWNIFRHICHGSNNPPCHWASTSYWLWIHPRLRWCWIYPATHHPSSLLWTSFYVEILMKEVLAKLLARDINFFFHFIQLNICGIISKPRRSRLTDQPKRHLSHSETIC